MYDTVYYSPYTNYDLRSFIYFISTIYDLSLVNSHHDGCDALWESIWHEMEKSHLALNERAENTGPVYRPQLFSRVSPSFYTHA